MGWLKSAVWGALDRWCTTPNELLNTALGSAPKDTSPSLGRGLHGCFCVLSSWKCVENHDELIIECSFGCIGAAAYRSQ